MKLQRDPWELVVWPARGGRITSLKLRGEELLDQGIGVDDPSADGFVEGGAWGWDEMVPNVEASATLPDHGEAWRAPWEVLQSDASTVVMRARGRIVPWELERTITLGDQVRFEYAYRNVGAEPQAAFWCAHPCFRYEPGLMGGVDEGASTKIFMPRGQVGSLPVEWRSGKRIEMSWDPDLTPFVSVWECNGDLGGYRQYAIEPAFGGYEGPGPETAMLAPGESYRWWLQIAAL